MRITSYTCSYTDVILIIIILHNYITITNLFIDNLHHNYRTVPELSFATDQMAGFTTVRNKKGYQNSQGNSCERYKFYCITFVRVTPSTMVDSVP